MMKRRKMVLVVAMVCLLVVSSSTAFGEEAGQDPLPNPDSVQIIIQDGAVDRHRLLPSSAVENEYSIMAKELLKIWMLRFSSPKANELQAYGETQTYSAVSSVGVTMYLQAKNRQTGVWTDLTKLGTFTSVNTYQGVGVVDIKNVQSGYHYRIRSIHFANHGDVTEQADSVSVSIYME